MDATDIRILRTMGLQPFLTWPHSPEILKATKIAKTLGLAPETVKDRIAKLEKNRTIDGYEIYPNFRHLGLVPTTYHFRVVDPAKKTRALEGIGKIDGVVGVYNFVGPDVCVDLAHRGEHDLLKKIRTVEALLGAEQAPFACFEFHVPKVERQLTALDWRIIQALRGDALKSYADVGKQLKVSSRTVRRRFDRMAEEGSFDIVPVVDLGALSGFIFYELVVTFDTPPGDKGKNPVLEAVDNVLTSAWPMPDLRQHGLTMLLLAKNVGEIESLRRKVENVPNVRAAEALLPADSTTNDAWIDEAIAGRIREPNVEPETLLPSGAR